jgi:hypothetical protein
MLTEFLDAHVHEWCTRLDLCLPDFQVLDHLCCVMCVYSVYVLWCVRVCFCVCGVCVCVCVCVCGSVSVWVTVMLLQHRPALTPPDISTFV